MSLNPKDNFQPWFYIVFFFSFDLKKNYLGLNPGKLFMNKNVIILGEILNIVTVKVNYTMKQLRTKFEF